MPPTPSPECPPEADTAPAELTVSDVLFLAADHIDKRGHEGPGPFSGAWYFYGCDGRDFRTSRASLAGAIRVAAGIPDELWDAPHEAQPQIVQEATEFLAARCSWSEETDPVVRLFELNDLMLGKDMAVETLLDAAIRAAM